MTQAQSIPNHPKRHGFGRFVGRHKAMMVLLVIAALLVAFVFGWGLWLSARLGQVERFPISPGPEAERPARVQGQASKAVNILVVGADDPARQGGLFPMLQRDEWEPGSFRSDVLMIAHLSADRRRLQFVSIPRDSYVPVEGHGRTKINAAFSYGGPSLLVQTVEELTQVRIDHVAVIDFVNFSGLVDTLGGVELTMAGESKPTRLNGEEALEYVRVRKTLPRGDLDRVQRQQNVLRAVFRELVGTLAKPVSVSALVRDLHTYVAVDNGFSAGRMRSLGIGARHLKPARVRFVTVPVTGTPMIGGASVVTLDVSLTRDMFSALAEDRFDAWAVDQHLDELPAPGGVD